MLKKSMHDILMWIIRNFFAMNSVYISIQDCILYTMSHCPVVNYLSYYEDKNNQKSNIIYYKSHGT